MTLLEGVNVMLHSVGLAELMSLDGTNVNKDAMKALTVMNNTAREVQMRGWHFNEEEALPIQPDEEGHCLLPANVGAFKLNERSYALDVTQRGKILYDRTNHTTVFKATVYVDLVLLFEYSDIPPPVRWYITARAARLFAVGKDPATSVYKLTNEVETDAWQEALTWDQQMRGETLKDSSGHFAFRRQRGGGQGLW